MFRVQTRRETANLTSPLIVFDEFRPGDRTGCVNFQPERPVSQRGFRSGLCRLASAYAVRAWKKTLPPPYQLRWNVIKKTSRIMFVHAHLNELVKKKKTSICLLRWKKFVVNSCLYIIWQWNRRFFNDCKKRVDFDWHAIFFKQNL